jgi:peptidylprolyl isomerase
MPTEAHNDSPPKKPWSATVSWTNQSVSLRCELSRSKNVRASAFQSAGALFALAIAAAAAGCTGGSSGTGTAEMTANAQSPASGLQVTDTKVGTGFSPKPGQTCIVHYTGWLYVDGKKGAKFDSSVDRKKPFSFVMGQHGVIEGWEQGVSTMKIGGKRTLIIPPMLAYGSRGQGTIPPNATLLFEVELLDVKAPS